MATDAAWEVARERREYEERRRARAGERRDVERLPRRSGHVVECGVVQVYDENWIPRPPMGLGAVRYSLGSGEATRQHLHSSGNYSQSSSTARNTHYTSLRSGAGSSAQGHRALNSRSENYHDRTGLTYGGYYRRRYS